MRTFKDIVKADIKAAIKAANTGNFKSAYNLLAEAAAGIKLCDLSDYDELILLVKRNQEYLTELENSSNDWLSKYYAGSVGASIGRDIKAGRSKQVAI